MEIRRRTVVGLGVAGLAASAGGAAFAAGPAIEGDPSPAYRAAIADISAYAARHLSAYGLPGLTLSVVAPDGVSAVMQFGLSDLARQTPVGPDQLFQIGSISKSFAALCVFQLVQAGKLSLDAHAADILPEIPWPGGTPITVQHLLGHGSGLPDDAPPFPRGGDGRLWRGFEPGEQWSYSNLGYQLLGLMVARLAGRPYPEVLRATVLDALGMAVTRPAILTADRTLYAQGHSPLYGDRPYPIGGPLAPGPWTDMTEASGCIASTAADMMRYARFLIAAGRGRGGPLLSDTWGLLYTKPVIDAPGWAPGAKYANGLAVVPAGRRPLLHHTGGMLSFNSSIHVDPEGGFGAFASTNVGLIPYRPRDLTLYACLRLRAAAEAAGPPAPPPAPPPRPAVAPYVGRYGARQGMILEVTEAAQGIRVQVGGELPLELHPAGAPGVFIAADPTRIARPLVFRKSGETVVRAWWSDHEFVRLQDRTPVAPYSPATPEALLKLAGVYESDDPWRGSFRVSAQGGGLFVDDTEPLTALPDGTFRVGEKEWSPERLQFDAPVGGRPSRAVASGADHVRRPV